MRPELKRNSREFELLLACLAWPREYANTARIRALSQGGIEWPDFADIALHHQVIPLVLENLQASAADLVPAEHLALLKNYAMENAQGCFQASAELVRLMRLFREEKIEFRVLKGAPLAIVAFGDATLRTKGDIDLLVALADIGRADAILRGVGYESADPEACRTPRRLCSYLSLQKDFSYENRGNGVVLDLHWRLLRNRFYPGNLNLKNAGLAEVRFGPEIIPTLPLQQLFLYLCAHGALDGWLRLKWLADIGALLRKFSEEEFQAVLRTAEGLQALPEVSAAIHLAQKNLGYASIPAGCLDGEDRSVRRILRFAESSMTSNNYRPLRERITSFAWFKNEFCLHSGAFRAELIRRSLFRPRLLQRISLPDSLFGLYAILSPFEWLLYRSTRLRSWFGRKHAGALQKEPRGLIFRRLLRISRGEMGLLAEAAVLLTFFRLVLKFLPVQKITAGMGRAHPRAVDSEEENSAIRRVEWAIGAIVRHAPISFVCFPQSLAAYFMLRRRHIDSQLFYGIARRESRLEAHTWIKVGKRIVVGGETEPDFEVLAIFP